MLWVLGSIVWTPTVNFTRNTHDSTARYTLVELRPGINHIRDSIVVSISACHAEDPGSIPGRGNIQASVCQAFMAHAWLQEPADHAPA